MMKYYFSYSLVAATISLASCGNAVHNIACVDEIYDSRTIILEEFRNTTVTVRNYELVTKYNFKIYNHGGTKFYALEKELGADTINLISRSITDSAGNIFRSVSQDSTSYVLEYLQGKLDLMRAHSITDVSADDQHLGITLAITACDLRKIYYVEDINLVENEEWKKYFSSINKLDDHWYYDPDSQSGVFPHQENR